MEVVTGSVRIMMANQNAGALPAEVSFPDLVVHNLVTHHTSTPNSAQRIAIVMARPYSLAISMNKKYGPAYRLWLAGQWEASPPGPTPRKEESTRICQPAAITARWRSEVSGGSAPTFTQRIGICEWKNASPAPASTAMIPAISTWYVASQMSRTAKQHPKATERCVVQVTPVASTAATGYVHRKR